MGCNNQVAKNMKTMTTVIIQYPLPPGASIDVVKSGFVKVAPFFHGPHGLLRKYFLLSDDGTSGGGVYLWTSRQAARDFTEATIRPMIQEKFHVDPSITYFETPVVVDNISSEILSELDIEGSSEARRIPLCL
jgi:hypothetical protein